MCMYMYMCIYIYIYTPVRELARHPAYGDVDYMFTKHHFKEKASINIIKH